MGWFNVLTTEFILVVSGRKDGVDLVLIYRLVVIFVAQFREEREVILHQNKDYLCNLNWNLHGNK